MPPADVEALILTSLRTLATLPLDTAGEILCAARRECRRVEDLLAEREARDRMETAPLIARSG